MKTISTIVSITLLFHSTGVIGQTGSKDKELQLDEVRAIFQQALDLPELQLYLHAGTGPGREQIYIQEFGIVNQDNLKGVTKFDTQVKVLPELELKRLNSKNTFVVGDWTYVASSLRLQLSYKLEDVTITYLFKRKDGKWTITDYDLAEN